LLVIGGAVFFIFEDNFPLRSLGIVIAMCALWVSRRKSR